MPLLEIGFRPRRSWASSVPVESLSVIRVAFFRLHLRLSEETTAVTPCPTLVPDPPSTEERAELLARAAPAELVALADHITAAADVRVEAQPQVGMVVLEVREPVAGERFHLTEVLVTEARVSVDGAPGWSMRAGDDRLATLAAAVCDAAVEAGHVLAEDVVQLCAATAAARAEQEAAEQARVATTAVAFEELDR
jgi:alpha-D-ribose 1-methylphosphonate 5-triphosphate synthase subunit PhnG